LIKQVCHLTFTQVFYKHSSYLSSEEPQINLLEVVILQCKSADCLNRLRLKNLRPYQKNLSITFLDERNAATLNNIPISLAVKSNETNTIHFSQQHSVQSQRSLQKGSTLPMFLNYTHFSKPCPSAPKLHRDNLMLPLRKLIHLYPCIPALLVYSEISKPL